MAESFALDSLVIPGAYVQVRADALIAGAAVSTGNIGIVGTAGTVPTDTEILSGFDDAVNAFGAYDAFSSGKLNITRGLELAYRNGGGVTFARGLAAGADQAAFTAAFEKLIKDDVNILVAPELSTSDALAVMGAVLEEAENNGRDCIAVVGTDKTAVADIVAEVPDNDRIIFVAPGIQAYDSVAKANVIASGDVRRRGGGRPAQHARAAVEPHEQGARLRPVARAALHLRRGEDPRERSRARPRGARRRARRARPDEPTRARSARSRRGGSPTTRRPGCGPARPRSSAG